MTDGHPMPEDRPDPADRAPSLRARVPDHVASGVFSTGAIVVTGQTEFIIDFLQTIGRPHRVAARVIIPHPVMPQFIEALGKNLSIYSDRFGVPPSPPGLIGPATASGATGVPQVAAEPIPPTGAKSPQSREDDLGAAFGSTDVFPGSNVGGSSGSPADPAAGAPQPSPGGFGAGGPSSSGQNPGGQAPGQFGASAGHGDQGAAIPMPIRRPTPQEIYDDLKIPDSVLSGAYANGVMIGHGASEFGFDFLTSFYPQSAVSSRVFMAAGQVPRLLESLHHAMRQLQNQKKPPLPPRRDQEDFPDNPDH